MNENLHTDLRNGLTTGTCAAAVAKAAASMLVDGRMVEHVPVTLPGGGEVILEIHEATIHDGEASCMTVKDAGDDPDVTNGIKIYAHARLNETGQITISAGEGIGIVTKPGLSVEIGKPAINPVPMKMIHQAISDVLPRGNGADVSISIPGGVEIAKRTFNPQLGIVGGISILGTTGVVKPMSEEALKSSLELHLRQLSQSGHDKVVLVPGNYATSFLKKYYTFDDEMVVQTSNFIGFMLEKAVRYNFKKVLLVGHIGKLVKVAGGIFNTHSRVADCRNEILAAHYLGYSSDATGAGKLLGVNTTEEAVDVIGPTGFWNHLGNTIATRARKHIYDELELETIIFSQVHGMLGKSSGADEMCKRFNIKSIGNNRYEIQPAARKGTISICGIGPGSKDLVLPTVFSTLQAADLVIAGHRHLELVAGTVIEKKVFTGKLDELTTIIDENKQRDIVVLVSGDTGFYSLRSFICKTFPGMDIRCIPGISSFQYLFSKLNLGYEDAFLASLHGKEADFIEAVRQHKTVFLLTDAKNTYPVIAKALLDAGLGETTVHVGCKLSYPDEVIFTKRARELANDNTGGELCSVILKQE